MDKKQTHKIIKMIADYLPLIVFFTLYKFYDIFVATGSLIITSIFAVGLIYKIEKRIPIVPLVTAILVSLFGGITLLLNDENFIKLKSTIIHLLFAAILLGSLLMKKNLLKILFKDHLHLRPEGWNKMTLQYGLLFLGLAGLNEFIRLTQSTDFWVSFKVFGLTGIFIIFAIVQGFSIQKYLIHEDEK